MKIKTWVELPSSKYDIEYVLTRGIIASSPKDSLSLNPKKAIKRYFRKTTNRIWKRTSKTSPFERKVIELDRVTRRDGYGDGTAVMYIREIFEPGDVEYDYIGDYVCATQLSQEQVDRLRIMIIPRQREGIIISYMDHYKQAIQKQDIFNNSNGVLRLFEGFQHRYMKIAAEEGKEQFDVLFSFTFAINNYSRWILEFESIKKRSTMIATLAEHWRKLFGKYKPAELGLDLEFSFPATIAFLEKFKTTCESVETFGYPAIEFRYVEEQRAMEVDVTEINYGPVTSMTSIMSQEDSIETALIK